MEVRPPATHAWVIPAETTDGPRYAVAWNGLVYPLTRLGPAADLEADVRALIDPSGVRHDDGHPPDRLPGWGPGQMPWGSFSHMVTASQQSVAPAKAILLLRLGRGDLAEAVWQAGPGRLPVKGGGPAEASCGTRRWRPTGRGRSTNAR